MGKSMRYLYKQHGGWRLTDNLTRYHAGNLSYVFAQIRISKKRRRYLLLAVRTILRNEMQITKLNVPPQTIDPQNRSIYYPMQFAQKHMAQNRRDIRCFFIFRVSDLAYHFRIYMRRYRFSAPMVWIQTKFYTQKYCQFLRMIYTIAMLVNLLLKKISLIR